MTRFNIKQINDKSYAEIGGALKIADKAVASVRSK
jgi:hypothetical protein